MQKLTLQEEEMMHGHTGAGKDNCFWNLEEPNLPYKTCISH
ncbi:MAG TPA: hypothetical protein VKR53_16200 [Puia sp.]|nr:hypothetical protein [Puia sp.]